VRARPNHRAARLRDKEDSTTLFCTLEHLDGIGVARSDGLFAKHVGTGVKRRQRVFLMLNVGRTHAGNIRLHFGQHFRAVVVGVRDIMALRRLPGTLHTTIKDGYNFGVVCAVFPGGNVAGVGDHTRTNHDNF